MGTFPSPSSGDPELPKGSQTLGSSNLGSSLQSIGLFHSLRHPRIGFIYLFVIPLSTPPSQVQIASPPLKFYHG